MIQKPPILVALDEKTNFNRKGTEIEDELSDIVALIMKTNFN